MTVKQDAGNLLLFFYDELINKCKGIVDTQDVVDNLKWSNSRINIAFNYLKGNSWIDIGQTGVGNIQGVQIFRVLGLSSQGIEQVEDTKKFEDIFGFKVNLISASTIGSQHQERDLNIEKQEAKRDIINVAGDYIQEAELKRIEYEQEAKDREFHIFNLRAMVQTWQGLLPEIPPTEETKNPGRFDGFDISFIKNIEDDILFNDLFHHYPECEDVWNNFKNISRDYTSRKQALYDLIKNKVSRRLVSENFNIESKIESGFCVSIFRDIIVEAKDKISRYKHFSNDVIFGGIKKYQVYYCDVFKDGTRDDRTCHQLATTNDYETIEKIHKELLKECKAQYLNKSKEIVELENKLRTDRDKLNFSLKTIYQKPFSRMDCEFVKGRK